MGPSRFVDIGLILPGRPTFNQSFNDRVSGLMTTFLGSCSELSEDCVGIMWGIFLIRVDRRVDPGHNMGAHN